MKTKARGVEAGKREEERWKSEQEEKGLSERQGQRSRRRVEYERTQERK